jgi:hypothetical protein
MTHLLSEVEALMTHLLSEVEAMMTHLFPADERVGCLAAARR